MSSKPRGRPKGYKHTEESKTKMRESRSKRVVQQVHSEETRAKIGVGASKTRNEEVLPCPHGCGLVSNHGAMRNHVRGSHEFTCRIAGCVTTKHKAMGLCGVHWGIDKQCRNFGYTIEDYYKMAALQLNQCQICKRTCVPKGISADNKRVDVFALDHHHATNKARGLICMNCNLGIGHFHDNPELMERAAKYIRHYRDS